MITLALPESWRERALVLVGGEPDETWFTPGELMIAEKFRLPRRRLEWKLSRMAAKQLAMNRGLASSPLEVVVMRPGVLAFHVSISHSAPYAGAAIDLEPVGIDVQKVREFKEAAAHLFLSAEETRQMESCTTPDRIIHFWTAKEAAWKRLGGTVETLKRVPLRLLHADQRSMRFDSVETLRIDDVVVALTRPTS